MVTAHPHPRAPQRPGLARRAARKGGWGGRLPALRTHLNCPGCHSNRRRLEVRSREVAKGSPRSRTPLIHQQRTVAPGKDCHPPTSRTKSREGPRGVSVSTQGKPREQRQPEPPKSLELEKGSIFLHSALHSFNSFNYLRIFKNYSFFSLLGFS